MKNLSLTARLSLLFALCTAIVLLGLGWAVGYAVARHFGDLDRSKIEGKLALVRNILAKAETPADLPTLTRHLDEALVGHHDLAVRVQAADGSVWFANGRVEIPMEGLSNSVPTQGWVLWERDGQSFRGLIADAPSRLEQFTVAIGLDMSVHQRFLAEFRYSLGFAIVLAAVIAATLGWAAIHAGLRPLRRVTALAANLRASRLDARLPESRVPAEIEALVKAFNAMLARLEESFQRLSAFSADIAHELRTPVGNLMIQTQVALSEPRDVEQYREVLYSNLEEYERMAQTITDMLFLAQADHGLLRLGSDSVDLAAEARTLFDYFDAWAEERGVTLAQAGDVTVSGDRLMLRRALSNLLANAIRHTPAGRTVWVRLAAADAHTARISVENPGAPIPAEHLPRLFDRFYRIDPARQRQGEGAGLGLAIVKSIVEAHGGTVGVTSDGEVVRCVITLPGATAMT